MSGELIYRIGSATYFLLLKGVGYISKGIVGFAAKCGVSNITSFTQALESTLADI